MNETRTGLTLQELARQLGVEVLAVAEYLEQEGWSSQGTRTPLPPELVERARRRFAGNGNRQTSPQRPQPAGGGRTATTGKPMGLHGAGLPQGRVLAPRNQRVAGSSTRSGGPALPPRPARAAEPSQPEPRGAAAPAARTATPSASASPLPEAAVPSPSAPSAPGTAAAEASQPVPSAVTQQAAGAPAAAAAPAGSAAAPATVSQRSRPAAGTPGAGEAAGPASERRPNVTTAPPASPAAAPAPAARPAPPVQEGSAKTAAKASARSAAASSKAKPATPPGSSAAGAGRQAQGQARPAAAPAASTPGRGKAAVAAAAKTAEPAQPLTVEIGEQITVKELAQRLGLPAAQVIKTLMQNGIMAGLNQSLDQETAALVAQELGAEVKLKEVRDIEKELEDTPDAEEDLKPRPPVVTIMGHVDHGKTTLLDAIRHSRVAAGEAGGITQRIGAYQVEINGKRITFLDTPGHAAFTAMRARGAQVTDIAVLVVAADDGVMPQTVEALNHAKAAGVPIIVAVNKIDKAGANPDRIKQQLSEYGLIPEEWGGDTIYVPISALRKQGLDDLLEMILLVAEMRELKANPDRPARGRVIEAELDRSRGPVATVLVQKGTLRTGDIVVVGTAYGKVRALINEQGKRLSKAGPSTPVQILGLDEVPSPGDELVVVNNEKLAREVVEKRRERQRAEQQSTEPRVTLENLLQKIKEGETRQLNVVLKTDVQGSLEAVRNALVALSTDETRVNIVHAGVGGITETDVNLADASGAIVIGFNVRPDQTGAKAAERTGVDIRLYQVIYDLLEDVKKALQGLLAPKVTEVILGRAEVRQIFHVPKVGTVAGCFVTTGKVVRGAQVRVLRDSRVVYDGRIESLKRFKDDVREVAEGYECGIGIEKFNDIKEGDVLEAYTLQQIPA
ncbi:MAG: translation initiation factor IF-2 [Limnochordales bacterium]|nr:translation initiation factor IF-2 [Limnochordales bacterium]